MFLYVSGLNTFINLFDHKKVKESVQFIALVLEFMGEERKNSPLNDLYILNT